MLEFNNLNNNYLSLRVKLLDLLLKLDLLVDKLVEPNNNHCKSPNLNLKFNSSNKKTPDFKTNQEVNQ
jgi:hypothetical protein